MNSENSGNHPTNVMVRIFRPFHTLLFVIGSALIFLSFISVEYQENQLSVTKTPDTNYIFLLIGVVLIGSSLYVYLRSDKTASPPKEDGTIRSAESDIPADGAMQKQQLDTRPSLASSSDNEITDYEKFVCDAFNECSTTQKRIMTVFYKQRRTEWTLDAAYEYIDEQEPGFLASFDELFYRMRDLERSKLIGLAKSGEGQTIAIWLKDVGTILENKDLLRST